MELRGKAFYNFLKSKYLNGQGVDVQPWQTEDLRLVDADGLFARFDKLGIQLSRESFTLYAEKCDSPEELTDCLLSDGVDELLYGQVYLLVFETWRRFCKTKQTLSLVCDEIDYLMDQYDEGLIVDEEALFDQLLELSKILDAGVDAGESAEEMFSLVNSYCVNDLETIIYDYASTLIENENRMAASALLDAYRPYATDKRWLDLLFIRLIAEFDDEETQVMLDRLFDELQQNPDLDLGLEMLRLLMDLDERHAFQMLLDKISTWVQTEDDFQQILCLVRDYFCALDRAFEEKAIDEVLKNRQGKDLEARFFPTDGALKALKQIVSTQLAQF